VLEVEADDVAASLKLASAKVTKVSRVRADTGATGSSGGGDSDPWASGGLGGYCEEAPF
jgi:hypothetical protein